MVVTRWHKNAQDQARIGEHICDVDADGVVSTIQKPDDGDPVWGIYGPLVEINEEVGPWGELFEFSDIGGVVRYPEARRIPRRPVYRRRGRYPRVFLNYRREEGEAYAGRLHEVLASRFGADEVFMNIFSIRPGEPFPWAIQQAVAHSDVMVSLVGPNWLEIRDRHGRRIDSPWDYVLREIVAALDRGILVIPVLLPGASVPERSSLPDELQGFEQLQMLNLSARHWTADLDLLGATIADGLRR